MTVLQLPAVTAVELARLPMPVLRRAALDTFVILSRLVRAEDDGLVHVEEQLVQALDDEWNARAPGALAAALDGLRHQVTKSFTEEDLHRCLEAARNVMVDRWIAATTKRVESAIAEGYHLGRAKVLGAVGMPVDYNVIDEHARGVLQKDTLYWVGGAWDHHLGGDIANIIRQQVIEKGLGRNEAAAELQRIFGSQFPERSRAYWEVVSSAGVVRAHTFGAIESFEQAQAATYSWLAVGDARTCATCGSMNGRTFSVSSAVALRNEFLSAESPEAAKEIIPWVSSKAVVGKSTRALESSGLLMPPIHGRDRCTLVVASFTDELAVKKDWVRKLDPPGPRHYFNSIDKRSSVGNENTIIMPGFEKEVDTAIEKIRTGMIPLTKGDDGKEAFTVNGRKYGAVQPRRHDDTGHFFPISGEGFEILNEGAYNALKVLIANDGEIPHPKAWSGQKKDLKLAEQVYKGIGNK